jgi:hypothetical protein
MCRSAEAPGAGAKYRVAEGRAPSLFSRVAPGSRPSLLSTVRARLVGVQTVFGSVCACTMSHNAPRAWRPLAGGPGPIGPARSGLSRNVAVSALSEERQEFIAGSSPLASVVELVGTAGLVSSALDAGGDTIRRIQERTQEQTQERSNEAGVCPNGPRLPRLPLATGPAPCTS